MEEEKKEVPEEKIEEPSKEDFEKVEEVVPANKFNQTLRKQRELEAEKRELEKKLAEKETPPEEEEKKEEDIFEEEKKPDPAVLIDEKLKPVLEQMNKREQDNRRKDRTAFFNLHPEYESSAERWQRLLDVMDEAIKPDSKFSYYEQLEMAHRIDAGDPGNAEVEEKKKEMAGDAVSGDGASKGTIKDEFTAEDRKYQKEFNISDEGMKAYKAKIKSGSMRILT